jgi:CheY-like chemotaxis protein
LTSGRQEAITDPTSSSVAEVPKRLGNMSILLVDDDEGNRGLLRAVLTRAGAEVTTAGSGDEALQAFKLAKPDLILTDIAMPRMDGYTLARRIREELPQQKIVALSAFPAGRVGVANAPFDTYLSKPIEPLQLIEAVERVVMASKS